MTPAKPETFVIALTFPNEMLWVKSMVKEIIQIRASQGIRVTIMEVVRELLLTHPYVEDYMLKHCNNNE